MALVFDVLAFLVFLFLLVLIGRLILDWVQVFSRDWKPRGPLLVLAEGIYTITDPPLRALRRVIKPIRLGGIQLDLAFMVLFFATVILRSLLQGAANAVA